MKIICNVATFSGREEALKQMLKSIENQTVKYDELNIYDNSKAEKDLTDNGKFYFLQFYNEPVVYLTLDDDLYYSKTYIEDMIKAIDKYQCIVTLHGRKLKGLNRDYYTQHKAYSCFMTVNDLVEIDIAGTGVCGFRTDYFYPSEIFKSDDKRMSDCIFSYEAALQSKKILLLPHQHLYIKQLHINHLTSCAGVEAHNPIKQGWYADEICKIKNISK